MKRVLTALLASCALAVAIPATASAHDDQDGYYGNRDYGNRGGYYGNDWNDNRGGNGGYDYFRAEFQHLYDGVQHGLSDGSFSRGEARQFYWAINNLRRRLDYYRYNDGYLSDWEARDIQRQLTRLHNDMHDAHANGHADRDYGYYNDRGYSNGNDRDRGDNYYGDGYQRR